MRHKVLAVGDESEDEREHGVADHTAVPPVRLAGAFLWFTLKRILAARSRILEKPTGRRRPSVTVEPPINNRQTRKEETT